jgi:soluble P-type ATPase
MLEVRVPGFGTLRIAHLVLDYNGTLAVDGRPLPGVKTRLQRLARSLRVHVLTADTFGRARAGLARAECGNDRSMLRLARLGVAVVQAEGAAAETLAAADLVVHSIRDALDLFLQPQRLIASLRA